MAKTTNRRKGELIKVVFDMLLDRPDGMQSIQILNAIPNRLRLSDFELGFYPKSPNVPRYQQITRFSTIGPVKAGWMTKSKGIWNLTQEGKEAHQKFRDPEDFFNEASRLYLIWKRNRPEEESKKNSDEIEDEELENSSINFETAEEQAREDIERFLTNMPPYEFQTLVADLLSAMGYHIAWIAPQGPDRGIDIIAFTDPLGTKVPRIKVQVKRQKQSVDVKELRSFLSVLGTDDVGIFVSTGGFTSNASEEARNDDRRKVTLLDLSRIYDLWVEHYDNLTQEAKHRFPLKPIYFLTSLD